MERDITNDGFIDGHSEIRPSSGPDGGWNWSVIGFDDVELMRGWARTWEEAQSEAIVARGTTRDEETG